MKDIDFKILFARAIGLLNVSPSRFWDMTLYEYSCLNEGYEFKQEMQNYRTGLLCACLAPKLEDGTRTNPFTFFKMPRLEAMGKEEEISDAMKDLQLRYELVQEGLLNLELPKNQKLKEELIKNGFING